MNRNNYPLRSKSYDGRTTGEKIRNQIAYALPTLIVIFGLLGVWP